MGFAFQTITSSPTALHESLLPSNLLSSTNILLSETGGAPQQTFDPVLPDTTTLVGFGSLIVLCAAAAWVWANQVVPVSRTKLVLSKKNGDVKEYLEGLQEDSTRPVEQWLFTDWLEQQKARGGRQKEPALPILKSAKWNSGDNPVLVATALIGAGVVFTSVTERVLETIH